MSFKKLNLNSRIQDAISQEGYEKPTPIQEQAIPVVLNNKDLLGCAQTGTGKTAAFALPILQLLSQPRREFSRKRAVRSLIVTPTRELALQIGESFTNYGKYTRLNTAVIFGGVPQKAQTNKLKKGVDILVATPGRLLDLMNQNLISLKHIEIFVLDEADRMLDMGFIHDINKIIEKLPETRQSLFFSATMPKEIVKLANTILKNPAKVEVTPESSTVEKIDQSIYHVSKSNKKQLLNYLLKDESIESALVFTRTKHAANNVVKFLDKMNILSDAIHGNKSQNARQNALKNFKSKNIRVLVATDIAARGIDIDELSHVINYDLPNVPETYVHRIGRTGRAGLEGTAISFCDSEERSFLKDINKLILTPIAEIEDHPFLNSNSIQIKKQATKKKSSIGTHKKPHARKQNNSKSKGWKNKPENIWVNF